MDYKLIVVVIIVLIIIWWMMKEDNSPKFVFFSADWCPHCQEFQSTWNSLKVKLEDIRSRVYMWAPEQWIQKIKTGHLDQIKFKQIPHTKAYKYNIDAYPTLRFYPKGLGGPYVEYNGDRSAESILKFIASQ